MKLLALGAAPDGGPPNGPTPLDVAPRDLGNEAVFQTLLKHGANPNPEIPIRSQVTLLGSVAPVMFARSSALLVHSQTFPIRS